LIQFHWAKYKWGQVFSEDRPTQSRSMGLAFHFTIQVPNVGLWY